MWLLIAVLAMLGSAEVIGGLDDHILPPMARWSWWTATLLACGVASIYDGYGRFHQKALGLVSVTLFYTSYPLFWAHYLRMLPAAPEDFPWAPVFVAANVLLPIILVTLGPLLPAVRMGRREA